MRYKAGKHPDGRGYTVFDSQRPPTLPPIGRFDTMREAKAHAMESETRDESKRVFVNLAEHQVVRLKDVPVGRRVSFIERASEHPPGKPFRLCCEVAVVIGTSDAGQVPCENSNGKRILIHDTRECLILPS